MFGYIQWLASRYPNILSQLKDKVEILRPQVTAKNAHPRTIEMTANLGAGFRFFLEYAQDMEVLTAKDASILWEHAWKVLVLVAGKQHRKQREQEPAHRFIGLIKAALMGKKVHVTDTRGEIPEKDAGRWGWESTMDGCRSKGERIGWVDGDKLYLDKDMAYAAAHRLSRDQGDDSGLGVTPATLNRHLFEHGLLAESDIETKRRTYTVRKMIEGSTYEVLAISIASLDCDLSDLSDFFEEHVPRAQEKK
jgi:hypothetical protein